MSDSEEILISQDEEINEVRLEDAHIEQKLSDDLVEVSENEDKKDRKKASVEQLKAYEDAIESVVDNALKSSLDKSKAEPSTPKPSKPENTKAETNSFSAKNITLPKTPTVPKGQKTILDLFSKLSSKKSTPNSGSSNQHSAFKRKSQDNLESHPSKVKKTSSSKVLHFNDFVKESGDCSKMEVDKMTLEDDGLVLVQQNNNSAIDKLEPRELKKELSEASIYETKEAMALKSTPSHSYEVFESIEESNKKKEGTISKEEVSNHIEDLETKHKKTVDSKVGHTEEAESVKTKPLTEKQKKKAAEREEKRKSLKLQKEQNKREKEELKAQKKLLEEERKRQIEEKRKQKKLEEEQERKLKLEQKEAKKKLHDEKIKAKEEARRKEKEKREAERQKKEAERQKKEEEKAKALVEEERLKEKRKSQFRNFFVKAPARPSKAGASLQSIGSFHAFQLKEGMQLAPIVRRNLTGKDKDSLEGALSKQVKCFGDVKEWIKQATTELKSDPTFRERKKKQLSISGKMETNDDKNLNFSITRAKLFQFHENFRPPYYGTWRKRSRFISARNPLKKDTEQLDYEFDSDDEWEEPVDGEDIVNSEGEEEANENEEDEDETDGFFVPHGYLSNDEGVDPDSDADCKEEEISDQRLKAKQLEFEKSFKQKIKVLNPISIGCVYDGSGDAKLQKMLSNFEWQFLLETPINLEKEVKKREIPKPQKVKIIKTPRQKSVPEEAIPDLLRLLHGNPHSIKRLVMEFQKYWELKLAGSLPAGSGPLEKDEIAYVAPKPIELTPGGQGEDGGGVSSGATGVVVKNRSPVNPNKIPKQLLVKKIREITVYGRNEKLSRQRWFVMDSVFEKYGLDRDSFPLPCRWGFVTPVPELKADMPTPAAAADPSSINPAPQQAALLDPSCLPPAADASIKPPAVNEQQTAQENTPVASNPISKYISKTDPVELLENSHKKSLKEQASKARRIALTTVSFETPEPLPEPRFDGKPENGFGYKKENPV